MRRYGRVDLKRLVATGNWRDERSAARYAHAVAAEEWDPRARPSGHRRTWKIRGIGLAISISL
jgi:hypothetical protein